MLLTSLPRAKPFFSAIIMDGTEVGKNDEELQEDSSKLQ